MEITELGMIIDVKSPHSSNALEPMEVTEFGMMVFLHPKTNRFVEVRMIALQLSLES